MGSAKTGRARKLSVAITGPTGAIGLALVDLLEKTPEVARIVGMARSPFDGSARGWRKTEYLQGDVTDPDDVRRLVEGTDVVVHLAFIIIGDIAESRSVNLQGSRNVFETALESSSVKRLVYTSSVAAYGFHSDNPTPLTEEVAPRGTDRFYYSAQKAELEAALARLMSGRDRPDVYVFRPCIVAGPEALLLIENLAPFRPGTRLPEPLAGMLRSVPFAKPILPDPGVRLQVVHQADVASALAAAVLGRGRPGVYNLAASGELTMTDIADELGWYSVPLPGVAVEVAAELVAQVPYLPSGARWIDALRVPVIMSSDKARAELDWRPRYDAMETLRETIAAAFGRGEL